jgi:hypothetical protein
MPRCLTEDNGEHINQKQMSTKEAKQEAKKKGRNGSRPACIAAAPQP